MKDLTSPSVPRSDAEYQVEIDRLLGQIEAMQKDSRAEDERFERNHSEILASLAQTSAILDRLGPK